MVYTYLTLRTLKSIPFVIVPKKEQSEDYQFKVIVIKEQNWISYKGNHDSSFQTDKRTITAGVLELSSISLTQEIPGEKEDGLVYDTTRQMLQTLC